MELKVGMYVRTKKGKIGKIVDINLGQEKERYILDSSNVYIYDKEDIKKASYNIIDLIEVGDYVNGHLIIRKTTTLLTKQLSDINPSEIKSIVTKEQFESMGYRVEE